MKDTKGPIPVFSLNAFSVTTTSNGTGTAVDTAGYDGALMVADIGTQLDTLSGSNYGTLQFQESSTTTASDFTDIAAADLLGGDPTVVIDAAAEDALVIYRTYIGSKRYLRMIMTVTGTLASGWPCSFVVVKMYARHAS
jgi:hypothetical protein